MTVDSKDGKERLDAIASVDVSTPESLSWLQYYLPDGILHCVHNMRQGGVSHCVSTWMDGDRGLRESIVMVDCRRTLVLGPYWGNVARDEGISLTSQ